MHTGQNVKKKKNALVVGAEIFSRLIDWTDRNTAILFGDGAGAMVISHDENKSNLFEISSKSEADEQFFLKVKNRSNKDPFKGGQVENVDYIYMNGQEVYKFAVKTVKNENISKQETGRQGEEEDHTGYSKGNERGVKRRVESECMGGEMRGGRMNRGSGRQRGGDRRREGECMKGEGRDGRRVREVKGKISEVFYVTL